uniref:Uncharacterized protein n=1 Tax=Heterorhabditis bacteriophora TaxID=37862 RepID=A0A1I7WL01_HETBA
MEAISYDWESTLQYTLLGSHRHWTKDNTEEKMQDSRHKQIAFRPIHMRCLQRSVKWTTSSYKFIYNM